jgi:hypothetical protein
MPPYDNLSNATTGVMTCHEPHQQRVTYTAQLDIIYAYAVERRTKSK